MQYSLLSRFRGALLGAALGDLWAAASLSSSQRLPQNSASPLQLPPQLIEVPSGNPIAAPSATATHWGAIATTIARTLIQPGSQPSRWSDGRVLPPSQTTSGGENSAADLLEQAAGWAIAALPLMLCYHDNFSDLRSHLSAIPASERADALVLGYTLSQILQDQLNPDTLIAQILADLDLEKTNWALADQLAEVQHLIRAGASLAIAQRVLGASTALSATPMPMAMALYCFLGTPEDFRLSLLRSTRQFPLSTFTATLAGAMSGCRNTTAGLPLQWRSPFQQQCSDTYLLRSRWGVETEIDLLHLADLLLAHWAGFYHPTHPLPLARYRGAIAAPNVIRPV